MLTVARCEGMALQTLGNPEALPAEFSALEIVDRVGRWLCSAHPWTWLIRLGSVNVVASQNYVSLAGLIELTQVIEVAYGGSSIARTSLKNILDARADLTPAGTPSVWAFNHKISRDGVLTKVLELDATSTVAITNGVTALYRAGWQTPTSGDDKARIAVPEDWEGIFILGVRAVARGYQEEDTASVNQRLDAIKASSEFAALVRLDGMSQSNYGQLRGGGVAMQMAVLNQPHYPRTLN